MDARGQTSIEYLILVAGAVLLIVVLGYFLYQGAYSIRQKSDVVDANVFE